eukprot:COSAG02_NODE_349_length_24073_cov_102.816092_17_plen_75_part_00
MLWWGLGRACVFASGLNGARGRMEVGKCGVCGVCGASCAEADFQLCSPTQGGRPSSPPPPPREEVGTELLLRLV